MSQAPVDDAQDKIDAFNLVHPPTLSDGGFFKIARLLGPHKERSEIVEFMRSRES